ncbi:MAG TPA: FISUMP domain-containing protein [bacterium]|nr:FISUMP domain-containing protein [bacterium]
MKKYVSFLLVAAILLSGFLLIRSSITSAAFGNKVESNSTSYVSLFQRITHKIKSLNSKFICGNTVSDRDGYTYGTVQIGTQCWMAENLKTRTKPNNTPLTNLSDGSERDCANDYGIHGTETDCDAGNTLYTHAAAMNGSSTLYAQGLCPNGFHVPANSEWISLESYLKDGNNSCNASRNETFDCATAGTKLKIGGSAHFNAPLSGVRYSDSMMGDMFTDFNTGGYFWTSTVTGTHTFLRNVNSDEAGVWQGMQNISTPYLSAALRCLKN